MAQRDLDARLALWSTREPVTLFGGRRLYVRLRRGAADVPKGGEADRPVPVLRLRPGRGQRQRGARLHGGYVSFGPGPVQDYTLRVTYLYRREDDEWKIIHRHGDFLRQ
jgi:hypothetical protein